jgi:hypothetical protein
VPGAPGLPDGRVYEEVSPPNKGGSEAAPPHYNRGGRILASPDGNAVAYSSTGPIGSSSAGLQEFTVAHRSASGWENVGSQPREAKVESYLNQKLGAIEFSSNFTRTLFQSPSTYLADEPASERIFDSYLYEIGGATEWLGAPTTANPVEAGSGSEYGRGTIAGASADLSTIYFEYEGVLTSEDEVPDPAVENLSRAQVVTSAGGSHVPGGLYEWHDGSLTAAGVLPDGFVDPYGALPAGLASGEGDASPEAETEQNQVSESGSAFFVSPDPNTEHPAGDPPELYVREAPPSGPARTVLVSQSQLAGHLGEPAPHGASSFRSLDMQRDGSNTHTAYVWATPNGSRAFFLSTDQLTAAAPNDLSSKLYEFNLETGKLTYIAGAVGATTEPANPPTAVILAASRDGSRFLFARTAATEGDRQAPTELDMWSDGPEGPSDGHITPIATLNEPNSNGVVFPVVRAAADGSSFVFQTAQAFPEFHFNNGEGSIRQIYRYDASANTIDCISCPPKGITPNGDAHLSQNIDEEVSPLNRNRAISEDGSRIFFDTPDPLVPQDANTALPIYSGTLALIQGYDVYEWENGELYLLSTGKSDQNSFVGDNSANGDDVFFSTAEGLVPGDTDGGYDIYDARIPQPGEGVSAEASQCEGEACHGPPSVPSLLSAPASATFAGLGNPTSTAVTPTTTSTKADPKKKIAKRAVSCRKRTAKHKRCVTPHRDGAKKPTAPRR